MQGRQFTTGGCISLAAGPGGVWAAAFGEADAAQAVRVALERGPNAAVDEVNVQRYVNARSLDGLFLMTGEEQRKIRRDPVGSGGAILKQAIGG